MARSSNFQGELPIGFTTSNLMMQTDNYKKCGIGTMLKRSEYPELSEMYSNKNFNQNTGGVQVFQAPKPKPYSNINLNVCAFINGLFYSYSLTPTSGKMCTSKNLLNWDTYDFPLLTGWNANLIGMYYFKNLYIMIMSTGKTFTSVDGKVWVAGGDIGLTNIRTVAIGTDRMIILSADSGTAASNAYYSVDGLTWTLCLLPTLAAGVRWCGIATDGSTFMIIQAVTAATIKAYKSNDGITWTAINIPSGSYDKILCARGNFYVFVTAGTSYQVTTNLGNTWTSKSMSGGLSSNNMSNASFTNIPNYVVMIDGYNNCFFINDITFEVNAPQVLGTTSYGSNLRIVYGNGMAVFSAFNSFSWGVANFPAIEPDYIPLLGPNTNYIRVK